MRSIRVLAEVSLVGLASGATAGAAEETPTVTKDVAPIVAMKMFSEDTTLFSILPHAHLRGKWSPS